MKPLDKNKKYNLSQLNNEQLQAVLDWLKENDKGWGLVRICAIKDSFLSYSNDGWKWSSFERNVTNALELFEEETPLKGSVTVKTEVPRNIDFKKELPNITFTQNENIYQRADQLMQDGKQHGLKIVVTFEKL